MKTMTTHTLRATLMALFCLVALSAMADATVNVTTTEGGQLQAKVEATGNAASDVTSLTVTGPINGTDIHYLHIGLTNVEYVDLSGARIVSGGTYGGQYGNTGLSDISTQDDRISVFMFINCTSFVTLKLPSSATQIDSYAFWGCTNLTTIELPSALAGQFGDGVFKDCSKLTDIDIPEGVTSIGYECFSGCSALRDVTLPSTLTDIGTRAFSDCGLTAVKLPATTSVGNSVFKNCTSLTKAEIGSGNMNSSWFDLFIGCSNLQELYVNNGTVYSYDDNSGIIAFCANCTLYVPEGTEDLYQASPFWSQFKEINTIETGNMLNEAEFALLQQIYTALDGANWTRPWDLSKRSCSQNKWAGLTLDVSEDSHVTAIDLTNMGITGTLPAALFQFPQVTTINIQGNQIEGNLTTVLAEDFRNTAITQLRMKDNHLTGDMSIFAQHFTSLNTLDVSYNRLTDCSVNISIYNLDYRKQFVDYKSGEYIVASECPVTDVCVGQPFTLSFNSLQTYNNGNRLQNVNGLRLYRNYVESWNSFSSTDGSTFNIAPSDAFRAPRNQVVAYSPNGIYTENYCTPVFLRVDWLDGDVNADCDVDVTDLSSLIYYVMHQRVDYGTYFNYTCADDNADDVLDVYDAVRCVNHILDFEPSADARQAMYVRRAQAEATANSISIADQTLSLATDGDVSAMQFTLSGANEADIHLARRYQSFLTMATRQVGNDVRVVLYNTEGRTLAQGMHNLLSVSEGCELSDAMLSDSEGHRLPAAIGGNATGIEAVTADGANAAYDLQGRRSSAQRGIHIINNIKVLKR